MTIVARQPMFGSYDPREVTFLLKDLSHIRLEDTTENREHAIQSGAHYSETLPIEYQPPKAYIDLFFRSLDEFKEKVAISIAVVAEQIYAAKGKQTVLVSLARAGTPIGILIKRYLFFKYHVDLPHYSISIIRDRGIDENALHYILEKHSKGMIQFVDGWTGKGAISIELTNACHLFFHKYGVKIDDTLAVLADPGHCTTVFGTREDFLIPSACLNSTVSGLVSRTVLNNQWIGEKDFHGAKYYHHMIDEDLSNIYLDTITQQFQKVVSIAKQEASKIVDGNYGATFSGMNEILRIQKEFGIESSHFVKPGVGETTRVALRRVPWKILIKDKKSPYLKHLFALAEERKIELVHYPQMSYTCCGLIKKVIQ